MKAGRVLVEVGLAAATVLVGVGIAVGVRCLGCAMRDQLVWQPRAFGASLGSLALVSFLAGFARPSRGWLVGVCASAAFLVADMGVAWIGDGVMWFVIAYVVVPCVTAAETGALIRLRPTTSTSLLPSERRCAFVYAWSCTAVMLSVGYAGAFGPWAALVGGFAGVLVGPLVGGLIARFVLSRWILAQPRVPSRSA